MASTTWPNLICTAAPRLFAVFAGTIYPQSLIDVNHNHAKLDSTFVVVETEKSTPFAGIRNPGLPVRYANPYTKASPT